MREVEIVPLIILLCISIGSFVLAYFQYKEKGVLINNAYIYATKDERRKMNKKPHYRQSAIVFAFIGVIFLLNAIEMLIRSGWVFGVSIALMIILVVYAIVSAIVIERRAK